MKKLIVGLAGLGVLGGCSFAARSPEMYRDETGVVLATKNDAIRACYDGVLKTTPGAEGSVTINFEVETSAGKIINVSVDPTSTAPAPVQACVTQNLDGLALTPPDQRRALGRWTYLFSAPVAAGGAAPPAAPPKT